MQDETDWDDDSTIPCPYCSEDMFDDSPRCPHCGQYITGEDAPAKRPPWWIIIGAILCLLATIVWFIG
jgi:ferredoxin-thioredoxin reductase catalytic subunit